MKFKGQFPRNSAVVSDDMRSSILATIRGMRGEGGETEDNRGNSK